MATGFEVQVTGIYNNIVGTDGGAMSEKVEQRGIRTLLGIHSCGFPNMFVMGGYQASFSFNLTDVLGTQGTHIARCIDHFRREGGPRKVMECRADAEEWWVQKVIQNRGKSNYSADCTPGYYNFEGDKNRRRQDGVYRGDLVDYYGNMDLVAGAVPRYFELS